MLHFIYQQKSIFQTGIICLLLLGSVGIFSQNTITVSGKISDNSGEALIGVSIVEQGSTNGTVSDISGEYRISVLQGAKIVFSYIGYTSQTIAATHNSIQNIVLKEDTEKLEEVVVVGYGTQKKANLTGAVSAVKFDDVSSMPVANTTSMLQGRLPGVVLTGSGSQAGKDTPEIRIRGVGTLSDYNDPMVLIDGVESSVSQIADIPASDIDNVSVLKDAASASIYGVRAANGVILITTKRGGESKPCITYSGNVALQQATVLPTFVNSYEWAQLYNEANPGTYSESALEKLRTGSDPDNYANTQWAEEMFRVAPMQQHHLSVSGGTQNVHYMCSLQYANQQGILIETGSKRYSFRSNIDAKLGIFKFGLNLAGNRHDIEEPTVNITGDDGVMRYLTWFTRPTVPVKYSNGYYGYEDGSIKSAATYKNPVDALKRGNKDNISYRFDFQTFAEVDLVKGLKFRTNLAYKYYHNAQSTFHPTYSVYDVEGNAVWSSSTNSLNNYAKVATTLLNENIFTYHLKTGNHEVNALLGHSIQVSQTNEDSWSIQKFPTNDLHVMDAGSTNPSVGGTSYENTLQSFFGRINYNYGDRYLIEVNLRHDGSSRMPKSHRYATFPSISAGWVASNEKFLSNINWLTSLKLRGSWGQIGNQEIGNYAFEQTMAIGANYYFGDSKNIGVYTKNIANSNIKWETTAITDFGLDASVWGGRISTTFDWYNKLTSDILLQLSVPYTYLGTGSLPYQNAGKVRNRGWEWSVSYLDHKGDFRWSAGFNLAGVKNEIVDNGGVDAISGSTINREGYAIRSFYGLKATGIYATENEVNSYTDKNGNVITINGKTPQPGDIRYEDYNGDGNISDDDRQIIGNPFPKLQYSFNLSFGWKGIDLTAFFQGIAGINRYNWEQTTLSNGGNMTTRWLDHWSDRNVFASMPRLGNSYNDTYSSFWLTKADYLRLKNLELGYTFKNNPVLLKASIKELRLYIAGSNLLTWSYLDNYDPEKTSSDARNDAHPTAKTYSFGLNVKF